MPMGAGLMGTIILVLVLSIVLIYGPITYGYVYSSSTAILSSLNDSSVNQTVANVKTNFFNAITLATVLLILIVISAVIAVITMFGRGAE